MAEKVVSPGVFTTETDLSFLPAGIGEIGAVVIGPTKKGPAFWPTIIESIQDFEIKFGGMSSDTYVPFTVQEYLRSAGRCTIVRLLGNENWTPSNVVSLALGGDVTSATAASATLSANTTGSVIQTDENDFVGIKIGSTQYRFLGKDNPGFDQNPNFYFKGSGSLSAFVASASVEINNKFGTSGTINAGLVSASISDVTTLKVTSLIAGTAGNSYVLSKGNTADGETIGNFSTASNTFAITDFAGGTDSSGTGATAVATLVPKYNKSATWNATIGGNMTGSSFVLSSSAGAATCSFDKTSVNYIENIFGRDPLATSAGSDIGKEFYLYRYFKDKADDLKNEGVTMISDAGQVYFDTLSSYSNAHTPTVQSQTIGGTKYDLFKFRTLGDGTNANYDCKVQIQDLKRAGTIAGSDYGSFTVVIRKVNGRNYLGDWGSEETDNRPEVVETFANCNFDPESTNFVVRRIGDRYTTIDDSGKITYNGDWPNKSKFIRLEWSGISDIENLPKEVLPFGFGKLYEVVDYDTSTTTFTPTASYVAYQGDADTFNSKVPWGFDFAKDDNKELLWAYGDDNEQYGPEWNLEDQVAHASQSVFNGSLSSSTAPQNMLKFVVPFQGGHDGLAYNTKKNIGSDITSTNLYGMDLNTAGAGGTKAYFKALNAISNADEWDINMISIPGVIHSLHPLVTKKAIQIAEDRGDAFVIVDAVKYQEYTGTSAVDNVATSTVTSLDSNYAATYWPWVKIIDSSTNKPTWVPPGVVIPGVIANTDKVAHEWFAPAGLTRGGLTSVVEAETRLTHAERDTLYEKRINPIATFPGEGVCVWGQKTLQGKPSALDRVNVRRLLIRVKKFIASASRYLVFEQNNTALRQRFLNIANPFLESVQQNAGLSAFRVVMDESNNTPDVIDRNQLVGQIFLQPTRTAEFIVLDFTILPTGATFPE